MTVCAHAKLETWGIDEARLFELKDLFSDLSRSDGGWNLSVPLNCLILLGFLCDAFASGKGISTGNGPDVYVC
jgi:hypothetical protein